MLKTFAGPFLLLLDIERPQDGHARIRMIEVVNEYAALSYQPIKGQNMVVKLNRPPREHKLTLETYGKTVDVHIRISTGRDESWAYLAFIILYNNHIGYLLRDYNYEEDKAYRCQRGAWRHTDDAMMDKRFRLEYNRSRDDIWAVLPPDGVDKWEPYRGDYPDTESESDDDSQEESSDDSQDESTDDSQEVHTDE